MNSAYRFQNYLYLRIMIGRKIVVVLMFLFTFCAAQAQIAKGTIMTGGYVGFQFSTDNQKNGHSFTFTFNPAIGGFLAKNLLLGVTPLVRYSEQTSLTGGYNGFNSQLSIGIGPFARYYVQLGKGSRAYFFAHTAPATVSAEWDKNSSNANQPYSKYVTVNWNIGPGISVMLIKGIAIEAGIYYTGVYHQSSILQQGNLISEGKGYVDHGMTLNIGMHVYIAGKNRAVEPKKI